MDENRDKKIDRLWFLANVLAWVSISAVILARINRNAGGFESSDLPTMAVVAAVWGGLTTLFLVSIPSRIAINLIVPERRVKRRRETLLCVVTFVILCWAAYRYVPTLFP